MLIELIVHQSKSILVFQGTVHILLIVLNLECGLLFVDVYDIGSTHIIEENLTPSLSFDCSILSRFAFD